MSIREWPKHQQPREKLLSFGSSSLSDAELLAIFLRTGIAGMSAVEMAQQLLKQFGSLRALLNADLYEFSQAKGLGSAKYCQLQACVEMTKRFLSEQLTRGQALTSATDCRMFLISELRDQANEVFACVFLDNQHRILTFEKLFYGTIDGAAVYPRVVVEKCLKIGAAAVIFAHNHPSGLTEPSQADISITRKLISSLELIDVRVLDHFIIGDGTPVSFAERGLL